MTYYLHETDQTEHDDMKKLYASSAAFALAVSLCAHGALPPFTTGGDDGLGWNFQSNVVWQSGAIGDNESTWLEFTVTNTPCLVSFDWKVSSERNYDKLHCYLGDEERVSPISGTENEEKWTTISLEINGTEPCTVRFEYTKDSSQYSGSDCGWVRNFSAEKPRILILDENTGTAGSTEHIVYDNKSIGELPVPTLSGMMFVGWFTEPEGGDKVTAESIVDASWTTLYAHWEESPFSATGGDASWTVDGDGSWKSGAIDDNQTTWIEIAITNAPCTMSFDWKVSSENNYDKLHCYMDGVKVSGSPISGKEDWTTLSFVINRTKTCIVRFEYTKDGNGASYEDCGWVRNFATIPMETLTVRLNANGGTLSTDSIRVIEGDAVGELPVPSKSGHLFLGWFTESEGGELVTEESIADASWTTLYAHWEESHFSAMGGDAKWTVEEDGNWKSGAISDNQTTWIEIAVTNAPCLVSFEWMVSSEKNYDNLHCYLNGDEVSGSPINGEVDWTAQSFSVNNKGTSTVRFEYEKDGNGNGGEDCGYVRNFTTISSSLRRLTLNENNGEASANGIDVMDGAAIGELPVPRMVGYQFLGWFTESEGGELVTGESIVDASWTTLYAHWKESIFSAMGGNADWTVEADGSWKSGAIGVNQTTWIEIDFTNAPCNVSFSWKASSEKGYDKLHCYLDGSANDAVPAISGEMLEWEDVSFQVLEAGIHTVRFAYTTDGSNNLHDNCGWVKDFAAVSIEMRVLPLNANGGECATDEILVGEGGTVGELPVPTLSGHLFLGWFTEPEGGDKVTAASTVDIGWTELYAHWMKSPFSAAGGADYWSVDDDGSWRSGVAGGGQSSWAEITVSNAPCRVSFKWKTSSEGTNDTLRCYVDYAGEGGRDAAPAISGIMDDWETVNLLIAEPGIHTVRFAYVKNDSVDEGEDCGWVKDFRAVSVQPRALTLNACGGTCETDQKPVCNGCYVGELPVPVWSGMLFRGWFTDETGGDCVTATNVTEISWTALYAHWMVSPFSATGGDAEWLVSDDGIWQSGAITNSQSSWAELTVTNTPCLISFKWKTSSERYDKLHCYMDYGSYYSSDRGEISGINDDWTEVSFIISWEGSHTIRFQYEKDYSDNSADVGEDCGWVKDFAATKTRTLYFDANGGDAVETETLVADGFPVERLRNPSREYHKFLGWFTDATGGEHVTEDTPMQAAWTTLYAHWERSPFIEQSGASNWFLDTDGSWRSGAIGGNSSTWVEFAVTNAPCTVSFDWKVSSEADFDKLSCTLDGEVVTEPISGTTDWSVISFEITEAGDHRVRIKYEKDGGGEGGEDCGWFRNFTAIAESSAEEDVIVDAGGGKTVRVPQAWLARHAIALAAHNGNAAEYLHSAAANGRKVWECYVLGLDPEEKDDFRITSFPMKADGTPDLQNITMHPAHSDWNLSEAQPKLKGAARLGGGAEWQTVTDENQSTFRFFRFEVVLP